MHKYLDRLEHYNSKLIPFAIIALLGVIIFELFLHIENHTVEIIVHVLDYFIIFVFVVDIIFLWVHSRDVKFFFKNYWLDLVAIFPFVLFFALIGKIYRGVLLLEKYLIGQTILHQGIEARKGISALARGSRFARFLRLGARSVRVVSKSRGFTKVKKNNNKGKKKVVKKKSINKLVKKPVKKKSIKKVTKKPVKKVIKKRSKK